MYRQQAKQSSEQAAASAKAARKAAADAAAAAKRADASAGDKKLVDLTIDTDGDHGDKTATITATHNHPFWVPSLSEWVDAEHLSPQQWLRTSAGSHVQISAIRHHTANTRVHNLTVAETHTYYVVAGGMPVLVHNCEATDFYTVQGRTMPIGSAMAAIRSQRLRSAPTSGQAYMHGAMRPTQSLMRRTSRAFK